MEALNMDDFETSEFFVDNIVLLIAERLPGLL